MNLTNHRKERRMTTTKPAKTEEQAVGLPWRGRAQYARGRTRKQRQDQYNSQIKVLSIVLAVTLVAAGLFIYANWLQTGNTKAASCADFPEFCVPLAGGVSGGGEMANLEAPSARTLDGESTAAEGVVRGVNDDFMPFMGNPDAPIHFVLMADYACPHCQDYHANDYQKFFDDYVLTGQATMAIGLLTGTGGQYSQTASTAALCAGEQGAFWEFNDELFRLADGRVQRVQPVAASRVRAGNGPRLGRDALVHRLGPLQPGHAVVHDRRPGRGCHRHADRPGPAG